MCNLYRMKGSVAEVAALFGTDPAQHPAAATLNIAAELYPGYRGLVVAGGILRAMNWGVPVILTGKQGQKLKPKPVTNARDDKLASPFWRDSFTRRRCLIPATQWAEPEGEPRRMTRTWYAPQTPQSIRPVEGLGEARSAEAKARLEGPSPSPQSVRPEPVEGPAFPSGNPAATRNTPPPAALAQNLSKGEEPKPAPLFAIAGIWRPTAEWGDSYAMVMCPASEQMSDVHDRMPVILPREAWETWTQGPPEDAFALVRTWPGDLAVERTRESWISGRPT